MRDRLRGTYTAPSDPNGILSRTTRVVKQANYIRMLGDMTLSAIPVLARSVMVEGVLRTVGQGLIPLATNLRGFRLAARETTFAGTALDMVLETRALSLADRGDEVGRHPKFERSEERRVGKECVSTCRSWWSPYH